MARIVCVGQCGPQSVTQLVSVPSQHISNHRELVGLRQACRSARALPGQQAGGLTVTTEERVALGAGTLQSRRRALDVPVLLFY